MMIPLIPVLAYSSDANEYSPGTVKTCSNTPLVDEGLRNFGEDVFVWTTVCSVAVWAHADAHDHLTVSPV